MGAVLYLSYRYSKRTARSALILVFPVALNTRVGESGVLMFKIVKPSLAYATINAYVVPPMLVVVTL